jgi:adenylate cyclase
MLTSNRFQNALLGLDTTYASITPDGVIVTHSPLFPVWLREKDNNLAGRHLVEVVPEFFGYESELELVHQRKQRQIRLESINRAGANGATEYFTFTIIADMYPESANLILLITNVSAQGKYIQALTQSRNELTLARQRLAQLSYKLDYVIRHYLSPEVTDALLRGEMDLELGGTLQEVTVLFADARGFTPLSEKMNPTELVKVLNEHLEVISNAVSQHDGVITQFQGDNLIAIFNLTGNQPDHATNGVRAGIAIQQAIEGFHLLPSVDVPLNFGVGIHTGAALVGNIGAKTRFSYTATGDTPNLAARITDMVPRDQIWISRATYRQLSSAIKVEPLPAMTLKGKTSPVELFRVVSGQDSD